MRFISAIADKVTISAGPGDPTEYLQCELGSLVFCVKSANDGKVLASFYARDFDSVREGYVE